jgi:outer membrane protein OmpA-like peptidoglycan-associated protein
MKLSRDRVQTVKNYLVTKGIDSRRITGKGYGPDKPVGPNDTEENRSKNRRVEAVIKKK